MIVEVIDPETGEVFTARLPAGLLPWDATFDVSQYVFAQGEKGKTEDLASEKPHSSEGETA